MSLTGGKRKVNKSLKAWVAFVKKVQKEEKLSYKDAIHRAKQRKDKGEKWMVGGVGTPPEEPMEIDEKQMEIDEEVEAPVTSSDDQKGGRRRRTMRRSRAQRRARTARRSRSRASRRH